MADKITIDGEVVIQDAFIVIRPDGRSTTISGVDTCAVKDGCLLILRYRADGKEVVTSVFGPGEWKLVNVPK